MASTHGSHKNEKSYIAMTITMLFFVGLAILTLWIAKQNWRWGVVTFATIMLMIVLQGMRQLSASPPVVGLVTLFGEIVNKSIGPGGWHWLPLYPFMYGFIPFNVERVNKNLPQQSVRTPDLVDLGIEVQVTFTPSHDPKDLCAYNESGGEEGVVNILVDAIRQRLREWAISKGEGPKTFVDALSASEEAVAVLLKSLVGKSLVAVNASIPTPVLLRYIKNGKNWILSEDKTEWEPRWNAIPDEEKAAIETRVRMRQLEIDKAMRGEARLLMEFTGIYIERLNIGEIKVLSPELAKTIQEKAREEHERKAQKEDIKTVRRLVKRLMAPEDEGGLGLTDKAAIDLVQTRSGEVKKNIEERSLSVDAALRKTLEGIAERFFR